MAGQYYQSFKVTLSDLPTQNLYDDMVAAAISFGEQDAASRNIELVPESLWIEILYFTTTLQVSLEEGNEVTPTPDIDPNTVIFTYLWWTTVDPA